MSMPDSPFSGVPDLREREALARAKGLAQALAEAGEGTLIDRRRAREIGAELLGALAVLRECGDQAEPSEEARKAGMRVLADLRVVPKHGLLDREAKASEVVEAIGRAMYAVDRPSSPEGLTELREVAQAVVDAAPGYTARVRGSIWRLDHELDRLRDALALWGKLFPPLALGPRCYDHAAEHAGHSALGDPSYAIMDLRPLREALASEENGAGGGTLRERVARVLLDYQYEGCVQWDDVPTDTATSGDSETRRRMLDQADRVLAVLRECGDQAELTAEEAKELHELAAVEAGLEAGGGDTERFRVLDSAVRKLRALASGEGQEGVQT